MPRLANQRVAEALDLARAEDFEQAKRGLIAKAPDEPVHDGSGRVLFDPFTVRFESVSSVFEPLK